MGGWEQRVGQTGVALPIHPTVQSRRVSGSGCRARRRDSARRPMLGRLGRKGADAAHGQLALLYGRDEHHAVKAITLRAAKIKIKSSFL